MNFADIQEETWRALGILDASNRKNWRLQKIKDSINATLNRIATSAPSIWDLTQESTFAVVAGTNTYTLNDWCKRPLSLWTEDTWAHKIYLKNPRNADRDGSRNPNLSYGGTGSPWEGVWFPRNTTAAKSGTSGANGATVAEGATAVTFGAGGTALAATDVGRMLRFNGESGDYQITAQTAHGCTVDRPVVSRIQVAKNNKVDGVGAGYTALRWEIGPPLRYQFKILPTPTIATTVYYRYLMIPRVLIGGDETPQIAEEYHHLLWKGAIKECAMFAEDAQTAAGYTDEFEKQLALLNNQEQDTSDTEDTPNYDMLDDYGGTFRRGPNDVYRRD